MIKKTRDRKNSPDKVSIKKRNTMYNRLRNTEKGTERQRRKTETEKTHLTRL